MSNISTLADTYAALDAQIKEMKAQQGAIRKLILETKENVIHGERAIVKVSESYPTTFSQDLAQTLLSAEDFRRCYATAIKATYKLTISATAKTFA